MASQERERVVLEACQRWAEVLQENEEHRALVTQEQWAQWEAYRNARESELQRALEAEDEEAPIFARLLQDISRAPRKSREELEQEASVRWEEEHRQLLVAREEQTRRRSLFQRARELFERK